MKYKATLWRLCVAPMMAVTHRHFRYLLRLISPRSRLYTEMVHANAVVYGDRATLLGRSDIESPVALQLGGSDPEQLRRAVELGANFGYDEVNLNVGCPSPRVQSGQFGACLMRQPRLVADCVEAMKSAATGPVTIKTRIGVDEDESFEFLLAFSDSVFNAGADALIVHARKAWLDGLSPKENRHVPPLNYERVYRLKDRFQHWPIIINGGIDSNSSANLQLKRVDGVMIGRAIQHNPWALVDFEEVCFNDVSRFSSRRQVLEKYLDYVDSQLANGVPARLLLQPLTGFYFGWTGARHWRRLLNDQLHSKMPDLSQLRWFEATPGMPSLARNRRTDQQQSLVA